MGHGVSRIGRWIRSPLRSTPPSVSTTLDIYHDMATGAYGNHITPNLNSPRSVQFKVVQPPLFGIIFFLRLLYSRFIPLFELRLSLMLLGI